MIVHLATGQFCLTNSAVPGAAPAQEDNPFHTRIVFRAGFSSSGRNISWSVILSWPPDSGGNSLTVVLTNTGEGRAEPVFRYQGSELFFTMFEASLLSLLLLLSILLLLSLFIMFVLFFSGSLLPAFLFSELSSVIILLELSME